MTQAIARPRQHLIDVSKKYPTAWRHYDQFREHRGVGGLPDWPDWCYVPMAGAYAIVSGFGENKVAIHRIGDVARLSALAAWRVTQGIYRYDPALYSALIDTPLAGDLPSEILFRLPEWCVYIETPGLTWIMGRLHGFWAHLGWDVEAKRPELRFLLDGESDLTPMVIHIGQWSVAEAVERSLNVSRFNASKAGVDIPVEKNGISALTKNAMPFLSLLLYLCAEDAEIGTGQSKPVRPEPKRTKQGWRLFAADNPKIWDVGIRIGAALRRGYQAAETGKTERDPETGHARPRAHIRRAHWHTFLAGTYRSERRLKWLPPIPVNVDDLDNLPSTVRPVK